MSVRLFTRCFGIAMGSLARGVSISQRACNVTSNGRLFSTISRNSRSRGVSVLNAARGKRDDDSEWDKKGQARQRMYEDMNKTYGKGTVMMLSDKPIEAPKMTSGLLSLDFAIGGGVPLGRTIEIFGPEATGKTTLALQMLAAMQKHEEYVGYFDLENAIDHEYCKRIGLNNDLIYFFQSNSGEEVFDQLNTVVRSRTLKGVCVDSVSAIVPLAEIEASIGDSQMAAQARLMSKGLRNLTQSSIGTEEDGCTVIFINQIRHKVGTQAMFGNPETTSGGRALAYHSSLRLDLRVKERLMNDDKLHIGQRIKVSVKKNKMAPPGRSVELDLMFGKGFCKAGSTLDAAADMGIITVAGSWYSYGKHKIGQGREKVVKFLKESLTTLAEIEEKTIAEYRRRRDADNGETLSSAAPDSSDEQDDEEVESPETTSG